jgi:hypothetical protein
MRKTTLVWLVVLFAACAESESALPTPLERADYGRLSSSADISAYLQTLIREYPEARVETFGESVEGRPLEALFLSSVTADDVTTPDRLTILIIGAQHGGSEPAGAESLLFIARDLLDGHIAGLADVDVMLIPNANPDGIEHGKRHNANNINLNTDFVTLTQPESQALIRLLRRYRPEVILDVHESAVLKKKSLAREGYMTNFSTQFETANNSGIVSSLRDFTMAEVLEPWIYAARDAGLDAQRYIGEIKSSHQPITNGGLTLNNFRNRSGIEGTVSFLMETRLDPRDGVYPTFRNIGERVRLQRVSIAEFIQLLHDKRDRALAEVAAARRDAALQPLSIVQRYAPNTGDEPVTIDLRRISDNELETIEFVDYRRVYTSERLPEPAAYVVRGNQSDLRALLDRQGIQYLVLWEPRIEWAMGFAPGRLNESVPAMLDGASEYVTRVTAEVGDLWIDPAQIRSRLAALILEPHSESSVWRKPEFAAALGADELPVFRILD